MAHPILFSAPMVLALLEGQKGVTRRVIAGVDFDTSPNPYYTWHILDRCQSPNVIAYGLNDASFAASIARQVVSPYGITGDDLWVKETWKTDESQGTADIVYAADGGRKVITDAGELAFWLHDHEARAKHPGWRPSIFMREAYSRLSRRIVSVRPERLHAIEASDVPREGVLLPITERGTPCIQLPTPYNGPWNLTEWTEEDAWKSAYACLWDKINGKRAPWSSNPWVWRVEMGVVS